MLKLLVKNRLSSDEEEKEAIMSEYKKCEEIITILKDLDSILLEYTQNKQDDVYKLAEKFEVLLLDLYDMANTSKIKDTIIPDSLIQSMKHDLQAKISESMKHDLQVISSKSSEVSQTNPEKLMIRSMVYKHCSKLRTKLAYLTQMQRGISRNLSKLQQKLENSTKDLIKQIEDSE